MDNFYPDPAILISSFFQWRENTLKSKEKIRFSSGTQNALQFP